MFGSLDAVPAQSVFVLVWNVLLPVGRRALAGGILSQPEKKDIQAMVKSVSHDGKMGEWRKIL